MKTKTTVSETYVKRKETIFKAFKVLFFETNDMLKEFYRKYFWKNKHTEVELAFHQQQEYFVSKSPI